MRLSGRMRSGDVADAAAWATHYRARSMREAGEAVLDLTIGEHDWPTDRSILRAMHESAMSGKTGYADVSGILPLRKALARRIEKSTGAPTGPDQVLVTNGGQAALLAAHMAVLDPGDRAAMIDLRSIRPIRARSWQQAAALPSRPLRRPAASFREKTNWKRRRPVRAAF